MISIVVQIIGGIALITIGLFSFGGGGSFYWCGAIIVGPVMVLRGFKNFRITRELNERTAFLTTNKQNLKERLFLNDTIDSIANDLYTNKKIPVYDTYSFYGEFLREYLTSADNEAKNLAEQYLKRQVQDHQHNLKDQISYFSLGSTIIKYDKTAELFTGNKSVTGMLILSKSHILFFPEKKNYGKKILGNAWEKLYDTPLFFLPLITDIFFAFKEEVQKPLSTGEKKDLVNRYNKGKFSHIIIRKITSLKIEKKPSLFISRTYLLIKTSDDTEMYLGTTVAEAKQWVAATKLQISDIALAEGINVIT